MNKTFALSLLATCASFAMIGCGASWDEALDEEERLGTAGQELMVEDPPEGLNHFKAIPYWAPDTQGAYRIMGAGPVVTGGGYLLPVLEISSDYRDEVLRNVIECALGQDQWVLDPVTGRAYVGHWGLATSWTEAALTLTQRRYVTGCTAQRLNAFGKSIKILLEGRNTAINRVPLLDAFYSFDESTVWGDMFSSGTDLDDPELPPFELYACTDADLVDACEGGVVPEDEWLRYRICDSLPVCGLTVLGPCSNPGVCSVGPLGYPVCGGIASTVHVQLRSGTCEP